MNAAPVFGRDPIRKGIRMDVHVINGDSIIHKRGEKNEGRENLTCIGSVCIIVMASHNNSVWRE